MNALICSLSCLETYIRQCAMKIARIIVEAPLPSSKEPRSGTTARAQTSAQTMNQRDSARPYSRLAVQARQEHFYSVPQRYQQSNIRFETPPRTFGAFSNFEGYTGDRVLRSMGGGYLIVTILGTLSRAIPTTAPVETIFLPVPGCRGQRDGKPNSQDNDNKFGIAEEVGELLELLDSLIRLGSPARMFSNEDAVQDNHQSPAKVQLPTVAEVEAAFAAGCPSALRRRVSKDESAHPLSEASYAFRRREERGGSGGKRDTGPSNGAAQSPIRTWNKYVEKAEGGLALKSISNREDEHTVSASMSMERGTATRSGISPRQEEKIVSFGRTPDISPVPYFSPGQVKEGMDKGRERSNGNAKKQYRPDTFANYASMAPRYAGKCEASDRNICTQPINSTPAGQVTFSSGNKLTQREYQQCCSENFAIFIALRWSANHQSDRKSRLEGESGFDMLARFAMMEYSRNSLLLLRKTDEGKAWWRSHVASASTNDAMGTASPGGRSWVVGRRRRVSAREPRYKAQGTPSNFTLYGSPLVTSASMAFEDGLDGDAAEEVQEIINVASEMLKDHFLPQVWVRVHTLCISSKLQKTRKFVRYDFLSQAAGLFVFL